MKPALLLLATWILAAQSVIAADCCCGISCENQGECNSCTEPDSSGEPAACVHIEPNTVIASTWEMPPSVELESMDVPVPVEVLDAVPVIDRRADHPPRGRPSLLISPVLRI